MLLAQALEIPGRGLVLLGSGFHWIGCRHSWCGRMPWTSPWSHYTSQFGFRNITAPRTKFFFGAVMFRNPIWVVKIRWGLRALSSQHVVCRWFFPALNIRVTGGPPPSIVHQGPVAKEVFGQDKFSCAQPLFCSGLFSTMEKPWAFALVQCPWWCVEMRWCTRGPLLRVFCVWWWRPSWNLFVQCRRLWRGVYSVPCNGQIWPRSLTVTSAMYAKQTRNWKSVRQHVRRVWRRWLEYVYTQEAGFQPVQAVTAMRCAICRCKSCPKKFTRNADKKCGTAAS